jgi:hypothetical protein
VEAGESGYLLPLAEAGEIFTDASVMPLPRTQPCPGRGQPAQATCTVWSTWRPSSAGTGAARAWRR